jgi:chemosensory pili system protein ChpA (sensor histidine kinase/response regulator)
MSMSDTASQFDSGPLSWVMVEIREALGRSRVALADAGSRSAEAQASALQHAKTHLHQAHGALQMVDVDGVSALTEAAEEAIERFKDARLDCSVANTDIIASAYQAVIEYLEELLAGAPPQPARLFPYYRALKTLLGADRVHPADLLFVDLSIAVALPPSLARASASAPDLEPDYAACRARFEKALLPFLKSADAAGQRSHALALQDAIGQVADAQQQPHARTFWLAMHSFAALVVDGQLASDLYVKQLFGLINLQIRRLSQGQGSLPEAMLRDALFFIAAAPQPTPAGQALRRAYRLDGVVPHDYDTLRYGRIDAVALKAAKDALAQAKQLWARASVDIDAQVEADFQAALDALASAGALLGAPALAQLLAEFGRVARDSVKSGRGEQLTMEMATAMLFAEQALDQIRQLPPQFDAQAEQVGARLLALAAGETPPNAPQWQDELSRRIEQDQTVAVLADEMKTGLRQVEKVLDDYYGDASKRAALAQIDPVLRQLEGALAMLDQDQAARAARHVRDAVRTLAEGAGESAESGAALQNIAQNVGALGFFVDMLGRNVEHARQRFGFDAQAGMFGAVAVDKAAPEPALYEQEVVDAVVAQAPTVAPPAPIAGDDDAIEAELLEIFIGEAQEVLALVGETLPAAHAEPSNQATLTMLRRSFHTLKGSGRMVGLGAFADGAAAVEKVMNLWLSESRAASADVLALLAYAHADMHAWVEELAASGASARSSEALVAAAARVQDGGAFVIDTAPEAVPMPMEIDETIAMTMPVEDDADARAGDDSGLGLLADDIPELTEPIDDIVELTEAIDDLGERAAPVGDGIELHQPVDDIAGSHDIAAAAPPPEAAEPPVRAPANGNVIDFPNAARPLSAPDDNVKRVGTLDIALPLYNIYLAETDELMRVLTQDFGEWRHEPGRAPSPDALKAAHTLAGTSATVGFQALREVAHALEMVLDTAAPVLSDAQHALLDDTLDSARRMLTCFALGELSKPEPELVGRLQALRAELAAQAEFAPPPADAPLDERLEALFAATYASLVASPPVFAAAAPAAEAAKPADAAIDAIDDLFDSAFDDPFEAPVLTQAAPPKIVPDDDDDDADEPELVPELITEPEPLPETESALATDATGATANIAGLFSDDLDADLLPVFIEEASDLLPEIGNGLRKWQQNPADAGPAQNLLRLLHTVKGSARMAGAMRLGQHTHDIETQVENMVHAGTTTPAAFDELLANYDHALLLFEQLQAPAAPAAASTGAAAVKTVDEAHALQAAQARTPLVRVRADILDRLVNQAGEVSITRSKLETQVATLKSSLFDFSDNLARLRRQLREVEMQAESQIASRMAIASEREFDPLEFDRFTRLQELTRMMAESVNDVASFHESLSRTVDAATDDLNVQSRLTRDLQRDLMRVRMVPFASLSERLFRVARQSAKEIDKRVNLDIRGGSVEIDRSVLEQMAAPFEHLLRNAIAHGIESRELRGASGKSETGELLVHASQQGNEVVIEFSDDGAGLDLARIRAKARQAGLLGPDEVSDADAADLIFEPGFSTAEALTELSGRGVGMDVVRSQAQALGGRVAIRTEAGKGARFTIHLPLTLAVTQVVLVSAGGKTWALPSILVEQVLQVKESALADAHGEGAVQYQGQKVALHTLAALLGDSATRPLAQRSSPVLILKSGADRLAVHVDDVLGNREVVIKNIGPQLARMVGIAGATVLGSGDIVLILNPVALAHHLALHPHLLPDGVAMAAVAATGQEARARGQLVMVVDDSLTVRRVTQRLLEREGYHVLLAKDGVDALEQLQDARPDIMLVDIEMPRMDGFDLTRNVRSNPATRDTPIIMITSRTADKHRNYALGLGVNAYFGKPFQEDVLLAAMAGLLGKDVPAAPLR